MKSFCCLVLFSLLVVCTSTLAIDLMEDVGLPMQRDERVGLPMRDDDNSDDLDLDDLGLPMQQDDDVGLPLQDEFAHTNPDDINVSFNYLQLSDLVVYANGKYEIVVKEIDSKKTSKVFTIQVEKPSGGICVDYKRDLLFFAHRNRVYRLHLVDDDGERELSGKGELFTNDSANHLELAYTYELPENTESHLVYDDNAGVVYLMDGNQYIKIHAESMNVLAHGRHALPAPRNFVLHRGMFFARSGSVIYNTTQEALVEGGAGKGNRRHTWGMQKLDIEFSRFIIDKTSNRMFFTMKENILAVLEGDIFTSPLSTLKPKFVMADSSFTKNMGSVAINRDTLIWSSHAWKLIYTGKLNEKMNFIPKTNVDVLDESSFTQQDQDMNNIHIINVDGLKK